MKKLAPLELALVTATEIRNGSLHFSTEKVSSKVRLKVQTRPVQLFSGVQKELIGEVHNPSHNGGCAEVGLSTRARAARKKNRESQAAGNTRENTPEACLETYQCPST